MKQALVIHPTMSFYAGGELLCLYVCKALQDFGYEVILASDVFQPSEVERIYGLGRVMEKCLHLSIPGFRPVTSRLLVFQRLVYARGIWPLFKDIGAEVVFSTQSSPFFIPNGKLFHFVYNIADLFSYPWGSGPPVPPHGAGALRKLYYSALIGYRKLGWERRYRFPDWFFAVGSRILHDLKVKGFDNSSLIFPPCRTNFKPRLPKRKQVIQVARLIPDKRLDLYFEIAEKLPDYTFYLLGKNGHMERELYPGYSKHLLSSVPKNVVYIEGLVRERPDLLEKSKVYLYTGIERGILLTPVEAMAAGCIPFSPPDVGPADTINESGVGHLYNGADDAAAKIRIVLESEFHDDEIYKISSKAGSFSPEVFEQRIRKIVAQSSRHGDPFEEQRADRRAHGLWE